MTTPIDYGKEFLENYFHNRDAEATLHYLADDVVWITPNEIRHLKSHKDLLQFMREEMDKDPRKYNVDIASIRSAPTSDQSSTIVYEVNLIPQHTERSVNLRCSLAITRVGENYELGFVGMSRKYRRTDTEQIRGFIESLPSGVLVLTSLAGGDFRAMYGNTYFAKRLGYDEDTFYDRIDDNPFFMMPYDQQRQMIGFVQELAALKRPRPLAFQVTLETNKGKSLPFQAILTAAYKDGSRTIYYMLFNDLSAIEQERARQHKKEVKAAVEEQRATDLALLTRTADKAQRTIDTARRQAQEAADELAAYRVESEDRLTSLQRDYDALQQSSEEAGSQYEQRIAALEEAAREAAAAGEQALRQQQADLESRAQAQIEEMRAAAQKERDEMTADLLEARRNADAERRMLEEQIAGLQAQIRDQQLGMARQEMTRQALLKEMSKSATRIETLLRGQTSRLVSLMDVLPQEEDKAQAAENVRRAAQTASAIPDMARELLAIGTMDPTSREELPREEVSIEACLETIRRVMLPPCREHGTVLAIEIGRKVPGTVRTSRAGLQMVLLSILENALASTARGGQITLSVRSDSQVRGSAYYHFIITDTGDGIDEEQLKVLFDEGDGELSITKKVLSRMGGSVSVTTQAGTGSRFEITIHMEVVESDG